MNDLEKCFVIKYQDVEFINALTKEDAINEFKRQYKDAEIMEVEE